MVKFTYLRGVKGCCMVAGISICLTIFLGIVLLRLFRDPILRSDHEGLYTTLQLLSFVPKDYYGRLVEAIVDVSRENTLFFTYKNKYTGGHMVILQMRNLSKYDSIRFHHHELKSKLKFNLTFSVDGIEHRKVSFDFENNFIGMVWAGEGRSGILLNSYMCPNPMPLDKSIDCKLEIIVPDSEFEAKYGPMTIFIEKIGDLH